MTESKGVMGKAIQPSMLDVKHLELIRENVPGFIRHVAESYCSADEARLLDIAPQDHEGARPFFPDNVTIDTLDINRDSKATYIADICSTNDITIKSETYDYVVCTEVLEHTLKPFAAVEEIWRILRPGGMLFLSVPFNFRIHGPLPDCWRFTEHGLRAILEKFTVLELNSLETEDRPLMPVHYTVVAQKNE